MPDVTKSNDGLTMLMLAARDGNTQAMRLLIKAGVDPELRDNNPYPRREGGARARGQGGYPLRFQRSGRCAGIIARMMGKLWAGRDGGWTALDHAKQSGDLEAIHFIETELQHRTCRLAFAMAANPRIGVDSQMLPLELTDMILDILQKMHDVDEIVEDID